ncbi:MAG: 23S rRNA (uracil(1939)-C(5))-methyltransferase RlmD, partial [Alicyclobacillus sp.]|nr:23S rRNA (uracil(1939)-C(5))-methyltransferase RlmD [Alicyclobacillus sp.]
VTNSEEIRECKLDAPLSALVFKTMADPYVGKLTILKVFSGKLQSDSTVYNATKGESEKIGQLYVMRGKKQDNVSEVVAGDIAAVAKLQYTSTNDTLTEKDHPVMLSGIEFPKPVLSMAVQPKSQGDEEKISAGLTRLMEEDRTFEVIKNTETGQLLVSGMGEIHLEVLAGKPHMIERLGGLEFLISPRSFFQVNTVQAERLFGIVCQWAEAGPDDEVLDAYCGTGALALLLAQQARRVTGIEQVAAAVADAWLNARHNGICNVEFVTGAVERQLPAWTRAGRRFAVAVLDPPRRGCDSAVLQALAEARTPRVVYVSCNPVTLARDARWLVDAGYRLVKVQPVDMFPQTHHVESCALFVREL